MRGIYHSTALADIPKADAQLYLVRPISVAKLKGILKKGKSLKELVMGQDTYNRLSGKMKIFLLEKKLIVRIDQSAGRPLNMDLKKMRKLIELYHEHQSVREISIQLNIPKSTIHYFLKHAERKKIKDHEGKIQILG